MRFFGPYPCTASPRRMFRPLRAFHPRGLFYPLRKLLLRPLRVALAGGAALLAGCYDGPFDQTPAVRETPVPTTTLAELRRLYAGEPVTIRSDLVVAGRVTATDRSGNFFRSLVIEADGAALEIRAGLDALYNDYPLGTRLTLRLEGLALDSRYGVLQAGRPAADGAVEAIGSQAAMDRHLFRSGDPPEPVEPLQLTIGELCPAYCGRLVRIAGLRFAPEAVEESCWAGYRRFADAAGAVLHTYVRPYADFADDEVPAGLCTLTGILQYDDAGTGRYLLKLRDETDCRP